MWRERWGAAPRSAARALSASAICAGDVVARSLAERPLIDAWPPWTRGGFSFIERGRSPCCLRFASSCAIVSLDANDFASDASSPYI
eukprot:6039213-Prymnesium_polylepis.1